MSPAPPNRGPRSPSADLEAPTEAESSADWDASLDWSGPPTTVPRFGRYVLRGVLGQGGMGLVYRALDPKLNREVALKVLGPSVGNLQRARRRFLREARAVAQLDHHNIIDIWDIGEDAEQVYFAMRLITGPSLSVRLTEGPLPPDEVAKICADLARALHHAHERGIFHRDIKPSNILFEGDVPVLTDFGLVKLAQDEATPLTRDAQVMGTAPYLAPELLERGADQANAPSDQYALGVLMYEALTARRPHAGATPVEVLNNILTGEPDRLESFGVPTALARICRRAMSRRPQDRFSDLNHLAQALDHWRGGSSPLSWSQDLSREIRSELYRRRHFLTRAAGGVLLAVALWGGGQLWHDRNREHAAAERLVGMETRLGELLTQGKLDEADRVFQGFTNFEDNQETRALARAWLHRGERLASEAEHANALTALAASYASSSDPTDQALALSSLASVLREDFDWDRLAQVLALLDDSGLTPTQRTHVSDLATSLHIARGQLGVDGSDPSTRGLLAALSTTTRTDHYILDAAELDDDHLLLLERSARSARVVAREPVLPERFVNSFDPDRLLLDQLRVLPSTANHPTALLTQSTSGTCRTETWSSEGNVAGTPFTCSHPFSTTRADLDHDGTDELYIGDHREFVRAIPQGQGWRLEDAHRSTSLANSEIRDLVVADLDGDGTDEIIAALGYWGSYDLRILQWREETLQLVARAHLGVLLDLALFHRDGETLIAVMEVRSDFVDQRVFSEITPDTSPLGIHLFAFDGQNLQPRGSLPDTLLAHLPPETSPTPPDQLGRVLMSGDLDGDGNDELIHGVHRDNTFIYTPHGDSWARVALNLGFPVLTADLDHDGDDELLIREWRDPDRLRVLGAGELPPPRTELEIRQPRPPPTGLSRSDQTRWRRIEQLLAAGFPNRAIAELESFSKFRGGTLAEALAWRRSAELSRALGNPEAAARSYMRAASVPALAAESLEEAVRAFDDAMLLGPALAAARRRLTLPEPPPEIRDLAAELDDLNNRPQLVLDYAQGLDRRGRILSATGLRWDPEAGGLRLRGTGGQQLLGLPLQVSGERIRLALDFRLTRLDWGSELNITLSGPSKSTGIASLLGWGGGGKTLWRAGCRLPFEAMPHLEPTEAADQPMTLILDTLPTQNRGICQLRRGDQTDGQVYEGDDLRSLREVLAEGEVDLTIALSGPHVLTDVLLERITLDGLTLRERPQDPLEQAYLAIAEGRSSHALRLLDGLSQDDPKVQLAAAIANEASGDGEAARRHLRAAARMAELPVTTTLPREVPGDGDAARRNLIAATQQEATPVDTLLPLLLADPDRYAALLEETLGTDYPDMILRAYETTVQVHGERADVQRELSRALSVVTLDEVSARTAATLLTWEAANARHSGRYDHAEHSLLDGWSRIEAAPPIERAAAYSEHARLLTLTRRYPQALEALARAVDLHPSPEGFADRLTAEVLFEPLHELPRWGEILAARKL